MISALVRFFRHILPKKRLLCFYSTADTKSSCKKNFLNFEKYFVDDFAGDPQLDTDTKENKNFTPLGYKDHEYYRLKGVYQHLAYFVTGKKNATFEDYRKIKEKDYMRELEYFYPERNFDPRSLPQESRATKNSRGRKTSLSIYTGRYYFYETLYKIESTYEAICQSYPGDNCTPRTSTNSEDSHYWKSKTQLESAIGGPLLESEYQEIIALLNNIVKDPRSTHMEEVLQLYGSHASQRAKKYQKHETDSAGFLIAEGARKSSRATIKLRQGAGPFIVNDLPMSEYFSNIIHRQNIVDPFLAISPQEDFEMVAEVAGGGHKGQSEAIRLGVARALACMNETWRDALTKYRYLVRDPRCVERKKPGQKKARKKFTWVKR